MSCIETFLWVKWKARQFLHFVLGQWTWGCGFWFYWIHHFVFVSVHSCDGMHMCVCICRRIREWDPRIHSLECEVCVLSGPGARNVSQTHCNNFKWHDQSACVMSDSRWWVRAHAGCAPRPVGHHHMFFTYTNTHQNIQTRWPVCPLHSMGVMCVF